MPHLIPPDPRIRTEDEARAAGYIPTEETMPILRASSRQKAAKLLREARPLTPVRIKRGYWWDEAAVRSWATARQSAQDAPTTASSAGPRRPLADREAEARANGLIPTSEATEILSLGPDSLTEHVKTGDAPTPTRIGTTRWWPEAEIRAWDAARRQAAAPETCSERRCDRPAVALGLCLMHYKRAYLTGHGPSTKHIGDPAGAGQWGVLDENEDGICCHECGHRFKALSTHLLYKHGMAADEYRDTYGIPRLTPLVTKAVSQTIRANTLRLGLNRNLDDYQDPATQAAAVEASKAADVRAAASRTHRQNKGDH